MNKVFLIGRLTRNPELRYTGSNIPVATFSLAVNRNFSNAQGEREADFINIVVWRKQAENVSKYLTQGSQIAIDGRIQTRSYDDNEGKKRYVTEVVADNVEFLGTKSGNSGASSDMSTPSEPTPYDFSREPQQAPQTTDVDTNPFEDFGSNIEISDSELPF